MNSSNTRRLCFLVGVDTEADNLWGAAGSVSTENAAQVERFQSLCEQHGVRPTYFVDYDMARDERFVKVGRDVLKRSVAEIGMHLHAWNTPPRHSLGSEGPSYLYEYPVPVMREKICTVTRTLGETFGVKPVSHRAGRWGLNADYARLLAQEGYTADSSVTPWMSWVNSPGVSEGSCGPDFRHFPSTPYLLDLDRIDRPGQSSLMEIPATVHLRRWSLRNAAKMGLRRLGVTRGRVARAAYDYEWFRAAEMTTERLLRMVHTSYHSGAEHMMFSLHSSELMAGGSPSFPTQDSIERLYEMLGVLFEAAARLCRPMTVQEFAKSRQASAAR